MKVIVGSFYPIWEVTNSHCKQWADKQVVNVFLSKEYIPIDISRTTYAELINDVVYFPWPNSSTQHPIDTIQDAIVQKLFMATPPFCIFPPPCIQCDPQSRGHILLEVLICILCKTMIMFWNKVEFYGEKRQAIISSLYHPIPSQNLTAYSTTSSAIQGVTLILCMHMPVLAPTLSPFHLIFTLGK